jgi:hypothetical protein
MGTGAQAMALLNDVPIWYELWRNINGFPPNYYKQKEIKKKRKNSFNRMLMRKIASLILLYCLASYFTATGSKVFRAENIGS